MPLGQALGRQQAVVQHMRAAAPRRGGRRPRDRASLPGLGHHQGCVRVPGADGGALRRNAPDDVGRNGPGRGRLDHPRRAHEGVAGSPRPALGAGARDLARRTETEQWHRPGVPQSARETTSQHDAIEIDQGTRHRRRAHGFRSSFRDWPAEQTNTRRDVVEAALAHTVRNPTEGGLRPQ